MKYEKRQHLTGSLAQAGVLSRVTLRRNLGVRLPSEPYRYPRLPQAAKTSEFLTSKEITLSPL